MPRYNPSFGHRNVPVKFEDSKDFIKVKFEKLTLEKPSKLPVRDNMFENPVMIGKTKNYKTNTSNIKYNLKPPANINVTNVNSVTRLGESFIHKGKKMKPVEFLYSFKKLNLTFKKFLNFYPNVYFMQDYTTSRGAPSIVKNIVDFIKSTDVTEQIKLSDLKKVFKLFLMKDICIFKILGEIRQTPNVQRIRTLLKKKIQKYIDDKKTIDKRIWESSDFSNLGGITSSRKWTIVHKSGVLTDKQIAKIATHNAAKSRAPNAYRFYSKCV